MPTASDTAPPFALRRDAPYWIASYRAMAGPCEIHIECEQESEATTLASLACHETERIEAKLSRYRPDSIVQSINRNAGSNVAVDSETAHLLRFAGEAFRVSAGKFDITSGVLRRAWTFDGSTAVPDANLIASLLDSVGWSKVEFDGNQIRLRPGMEIDLGGLGKEYAADCVAQLLHADSNRRLMVNFGGDIRAVGSTAESPPWRIGIENPEQSAGAIGEIELRNGGVATSGDARRYCIVDGRHLSHILDPLTGWPVDNPPQSVTVLAGYCLEAGLFSTLAMLQGEGAEQFLKEQNLMHHCVRQL